MDRLLWVMRSKVRLGYAAVNPELSLKWNWGGGGWGGGGGGGGLNPRRWGKRERVLF